MKRVIVVMLLLMLGWQPQLVAETAVEAEVAAEKLAEPTVEQEKGKKEKGWSGLTIALLVFAFAVLFIMSSATAVSRMAYKHPPRSGEAKPPVPAKDSDDSERFRL